MSKSVRVPQKPKAYSPQIKKEKSFKIHEVNLNKKPKHKKAYYNEPDSTED